MSGGDISGKENSPQVQSEPEADTSIDEGVNIHVGDADSSPSEVYSLMTFSQHSDDPLVTAAADSDAEVRRLPSNS